jgi:hypothetical protein
MESVFNMSELEDLKLKWTRLLGEIAAIKRCNNSMLEAVEQISKEV